MVIRLNALQIPKFWNHIKYSLQQTDRIGSDIAESRFNEVFASLLCDKSQCLISHYENKISAIMITEIIENRITKDKVFNLRSLYVFNAFSVDKWQEHFDILKELAISSKCSKITFDSLNNKIIGIAKSVGFIKRYSNMCYSLED